MGNPADLKPGSMISVELMAGDLSVGADGTVTHIDGNRMWAFGHRFLAVGSTAGLWPARVETRRGPQVRHQCIRSRVAAEHGQHPDDHPDLFFTALGVFGGGLGLPSPARRGVQQIVFFGAYQPFSHNTNIITARPKR